MLSPNNVHLYSNLFYCLVMYVAYCYLSTLFPHVYKLITIHKKESLVGSVYGSVLPVQHVTSNQSKV